jgi:hypothetical protein
VTQGLVRRLNSTPVVANDTISLTRGFGYLNVPRTTALMWNLYHIDAAARRRPRGWVDPPSSPMLQLYRLLFTIMSDTYTARGDTVHAARADSVVQALEWNIPKPRR